MGSHPLSLWRGEEGRGVCSGGYGVQIRVPLGQGIVLFEGRRRRSCEGGGAGKEEPLRERLRQCIDGKEGA